MRTGQVRLIAAVAAAGLAAALGSALAAEGEDDAALVVAGGDEELIDRLLVLEQEIPAPLPSAAELASNELDAVLSGSFTTARTALDQLEPDLRALFVSADEAETAVGDAIADVTSALLLERQALMVLEDADGSADARPIDASDARTEDGVALDADGELGLALVGVDLLLSARTDQAGGYGVLAELTTEDERDVFDGRAATLVSYVQDVGVDLRRISARESAQILVPTSRFDAPVGVARATAATYACVDRALYLELADSPQAERVAAAAIAPPDPECVEAARRAGLSLDDQQALAETTDADDDA